jgi:hypothetical protein
VCVCMYIYIYIYIHIHMHIVLRELRVGEFHFVCGLSYA